MQQKSGTEPEYMTEQALSRAFNIIYDIIMLFEIKEA